MLEQELFDLLSRTSDAAFAITDWCEICSWNKAAERLFGYSAAEAIKKNCQSLLQGRGVLGIQAWGDDSGVRDSAAKHLDIPDFDLNVKIRSGRRIWVNVSTLLFENPRNHRRLIIQFARDITVRKKNEELLHKMMDISRQLASIPDVVMGPTPISPLSEHEKNILRLFSSGKNAAQIARSLGITPQTLRNHLHHINQKLRTHNRLEAVTHATQRKLLWLPTSSWRSRFHPQRGLYRQFYPVSCTPGVSSCTIERLLAQNGVIRSTHNYRGCLASGGASGTSSARRGLTNRCPQSPSKRSPHPA